MDIAELVGIVAPPVVSPPATNWDEVESRLGPLPADYKQLIDVYGAGTFWGDLGVGGPDWIVAKGQQSELVDILHEYAEEGPDSIDTAPVANSIAAIGTATDTYLAWGGATGGQIGFWRTTDADPDKWPVVFTSMAALDYAVDGIVSYLVGLLSGAFPTLALPEGWLTTVSEMSVPAFERT